MPCITPCRLEKVSDRQSPTGLHRRDGNDRNICFTYLQRLVFLIESRGHRETRDTKEYCSQASGNWGIDGRLYETQHNRDLISEIEK